MNETQQHTAGPWRIDVPDVTDPNAAIAHRYIGNDGAVCMTLIDSGRGDWKQGTAMANARLIAAAPDMLAALRYAADQDCCELDGIKSNGRDACFSCAARAAIAKATTP